MRAFDGNHPVPAHFAFMARHLVADLDRTLDITAPREGGNGSQQARIVVGDIRSDEAFRVFFGEKCSRKDSGNKAGMLHQRGLERDVRAQTANQKDVQRFTQACNGLIAIVAVADEFGDHRIVVHRYFATLIYAGVHTHLVFDRFRRLESDQSPGRRHETPEGIFGIDSTLDGPALWLDIGLSKGEFFTSSDPDHQFDNVESGDHLGHRMFDLQARVHFEEVERFVRADNELDGSCALVVDCFGQRDCLLAHRFPDRVIDEWRRRFLYDLLVAALNRTLPLKKINGVAMSVSDDLDFDVVRSLNKLLNEDAIVAKAVARFIAAGIKSF